MPIKLYTYAKCSTCRKAQSYLEQRELTYTPVDITEKPPSKTEIKRMIDTYDGNVRKLFNTSGQLYREMGLSTKLPRLTKAEAVDLLSEHGKLVKRPFLVKDGESVAVGFNEDAWRELI